MTFIRKKKMPSGKLCAYEVNSFWDASKKQSRCTSKYLGIIGNNGEIIPKGTQKRGRPRSSLEKEPMILDFGNGFLVKESIKRSAVYGPLKPVLDRFKGLLPLMSYRLCHPGPMYNAKFWLQGNALQFLEKCTSFTSQSISRMLVYLGKESVQREFFKNYLKCVNTNGTKNIIIDATSLPNQSNTDFNCWGYNEGGIDKQFRFHCVVDQIAKRPIFYRYVPGNVADVSTLQVTINELTAMGVKQRFALVDAGYCSQENIDLLRKHNIDFLMRLPSGRNIYKTMIEDHANELEKLENAISYGNRSLFVKSYEIDDLYGEKGHVHMILDPYQKAKRIQKLIEERKEKDPKKINEKKDKYNLMKAGIFILISSQPILSEDILHAYYTRQSIEQMFGFFKNDLDSLPIRCHSENAIRGYLFLQFLLIIVFIEIRERILNNFTVEQALMITKSLKCKVYENKAIVQDLTKDQRKIFELSEILVPKLIGGI